VAGALARAARGQQRTLELLKDLSRVNAMLLNPDVSNEHRAIAEAIKFVSVTFKAAGYRARGDPENKLENESSFRSLTALYLDACAEGDMTPESALHLLRMSHPKFPVTEQEFTDLVARLRSGRVRGGKWAQLGRRRRARTCSPERCADVCSSVTSAEPVFS
jgi:hypothetical protein